MNHLKGLYIAIVRIMFHEDFHVTPITLISRFRFQKLNSEIESFSLTKNSANFVTYQDFSLIQNP